jgi:hypothetical protein
MHLFTARPELAKCTLAPMKPVMIKSRDGLEEEPLVERGGARQPLPPAEERTSER